MGTDNCIGYTARSQALKIRECIFRAGEQDDICFFYLVDIVRIIGIEARIHIQYVEVGEIRHSFQQDDRHVDFSVPVSIVFHIEGDRIFFFNFDIAKPRNHTYYRHTGQVLDNLPAIVKKRCISGFRGRLFRKQIRKRRLCLCRQPKRWPLLPARPSAYW